MKKVLLLPLTLIVFLFGCFVQCAKAQSWSETNGDFRSGGDAKLATSIRYDDIDGSPYFDDNWLPGEAKLADGKSYTKVFLKYDEVNNMVIFKYAMTDSALMFAQPVLEFKLNNATNSVKFVSGFAPVDSAPVNAFYELLSNGNLQLLKRTSKKILKTPGGISAAEIKRRIEEDNTYYLAKDKKLTRINNSNKAVVAALGDKGPKVKQYIDHNKLNVKNDADFAKAIDYYNSF